MQSSQRKQKAENFRKNIRREELDNYFQERRSQILQIMEQQEVREISHELQNTIQKQKFLEQAARDLCGEPKIEWLPTIKQLRKVLIVFGGEFHLWISKSIISNLCLTFKQQYKEVGLADEVTSLLIDMVYLSSENNSKFVPNLMQYEIVADVLGLAADQYKPIDGKIHFLMLLSKIAGYNVKYRDSIIRDGAGFLIVEIGKELKSLVHINQKILHKYLEVTLNFCTFQNNHKFNHLVNLSSPVSQIVIYFMSAEEISSKVLSTCLSIINSFLKLQKQIVNRNIYYNNQFVPKALSLFQHPQQSIRVKISITFCFLTNFEQYSKDLIHKGILDCFYNAYEKLQTKKNIIFTRSALYSLSNMAENQYQAQLIAFHPAFSIVAQEIASQSPNMETAYFCLNSVFMQLKYLKLEQLLKKYDLLKYLVQILLQTIYSHTVYIEVIEILSVIIKKSLQIFYPENPIISKLEGLYNISIVVENIRNNVKNKLIAEKSDLLISLIQDNLHNYHENINSI